MRSFVLLIIAQSGAARLGARVEAAETAQPPALVNPGFEQGEAGKAPPAWTLRPLSRVQHYDVRLTNERPRVGQMSVEISHPTPLAHFGETGFVTQDVLAWPLQGRRIRFRAAARAESQGGRSFAGLCARATRPGGKPAHFADTAARPIRSRDWADYDVVLDVPDDAERLEVGFFLSATGKAWFDQADLEVIGKAGDGNEPPRPLTGRGVDNLVAFTRLLGYVRYFHPSDEAAGADWERFAIEAVGAVELARTPAELTARLTGLFAPLAPTVQVFPTATPVARPQAPLSSDPGVRAVAWRHVGVACNGTPGHYRSERVTDRNPDNMPKLPLSPEPLPKLGQPFEAELGGGVSCRVPLALLADAQGTLPRATVRSRPPVKPANFPPTGNDRATRLADVALTWSVLQHFYPYFDVVVTDWPAALPVALVAAASDADAAAFHDTLRRLLAQLHDSHGFVRGGSSTLAMDGALPLAWDWIENHMVVTWVDPTAGKLRLKPGDVVRSIDGKPAAERMRAAEQLVSGATPQFRRYRALQDLCNGPAGQSVSLELEAFNGPPRTLTLTRRPADDSPLRGPSLREPRLDKVTEIKPGVLYLDLDRLSNADMYQVLPRLQKAFGVIFDVRGYPGVDVWMLTLLTDRGVQSDRWLDVITRFPDRHRLTYDESDWSLPSRGAKLGVKAAFLTDGRAVSAAETFLGVVASHRLGPIVGGPTAGSNGMVNLYVLPGGYTISWTGMRVLHRDGSRHHGVGILPTVVVHRTIKGLAQGRDEVLDRAVEIVSGHS
jgi:C-terminal processing protease CtpA/Prc